MVVPQTVRETLDRPRFGFSIEGPTGGALALRECTGVQHVAIDGEALSFRFRTVWILSRILEVAHLFRG